MCVCVCVVSNVSYSLQPFKMNDFMKQQRKTINRGQDYLAMLWLHQTIYNFDDEIYEYNRHCVYAQHFESMQVDREL